MGKKKGKKRSTASVRNIPQSNGSKNAQKIPIQRAKCQTNPPSKKKRPNISLENEQKYCQEMVFSLKKTKNSLIKSNEKNKNFALFCSCEFVLEINTPEE